VRAADSADSCVYGCYMMSYKRSERVGDLIKKEIASMILHGEVKDPRIGFVTVTRVKMTEDLKHAHIFFSMIGTEEEVLRSKAGLNSASGYMRRALAKRLSLKYIPAIDFEFDDSLEYSSHIEEVLKKLKKGGGCA